MMATPSRGRLRPTALSLSSHSTTNFHLLHRAITDRHPLYNNIQPWAYHLLPGVYAGGKDTSYNGMDVFTEDQLDDVLSLLCSLGYDLV